MRTGAIKEPGWSSQGGKKIGGSTASSEEDAHQARRGPFD